MISKTITILGNYGSKRQVSDGGSIKIRLYAKLLKENGFQVDIVDLEGWKSKIFKILRRIKQAIAKKNVILIMAGPRGCRATIPLVNKLNRKKGSRVVFCPLGIGTLDSLLQKLSQDQVSAFLNCEDFYHLDDRKMGRQLAKLDLVAPQNERLVKVYKDFYKLTNVLLLRNYRDERITAKRYSKDGECLNVLYASRVCANKGIFDLITAVAELNETSYNVKLDIYGEMQLSENEQANFFSSISDKIKYCGTAKSEEMVNLMKNYDLFCLPTKYYAEGTSGSLVESFISGTPALISSYSQASLLINDGEDGFVFKIGDVEDLKIKILSVYSDKAKLEKVGKAAQEKAKQYLFEYNKKRFFEAICGEEI